MNRQCEPTIRIIFPPIVSKQTSRPLYASYGVEKYTNASIFVHLSVGCVHLSVRPSVGPPPPLHSAAVRAANTPASHRSLCALSRAIRIHRLRCPLAVCLYYSLSTECGKVESVFCRRFSLRLHVRVYICAYRPVGFVLYLFRVSCRLSRLHCRPYTTVSSIHNT